VKYLLEYILSTMPQAAGDNADPPFQTSRQTENPTPRTLVLLIGPDCVGGFGVAPNVRVWAEFKIQGRKMTKKTPDPIRDAIEL
jgi:hypothetical protein